LGAQLRSWQLRSWRRRHGEHVVAEVTPVPGMGVWQPWACCGPDGLDRRPYQRHFSLLTEAQKAADVMASELFPHRCNGQCGPWLPISRQDSSIAS